MKARLPLLVALMVALSAASALAQGFNALSADGPLDVWAAGDGGVLYRSYDGGLHWTSRTLGSLALRDLVTGATPIVVADSGQIWRAADGAWALTVVPGQPHLRSIAMPTDSLAWVVGAAGTILASTDGGQTWNPQTSGTGVTLEAVRFTSASEGWAVGAEGTVLHTVDGGALWSPVAVGTTQTLYAIDAAGSTLWAVGANAAVKSVDGGVNWSPVRLRLDSRADVRVVRLEGANTVWLAGGGGFIRKSVDGGATWSFPNHAGQGQISDLARAGGSAWACSNRHRVIEYSANNGATWSMPPGASVSKSWSFRKDAPGATIRGRSFALNPFDRNVVYCALGATIFRSPDAGVTWYPMSAVPGVSKVSALLVSPKDSSLMVVAAGEPKQILRTTNHGVAWTSVLTHFFGEFGIPLEADPDHPDTVYFGADNDKLYRSTDFGATWNPWSLVTFRSPCNIVAVPDSSNIVLLGDGITGFGEGEYWKSTDYGRTFVVKDTLPVGASEIPGMASSRLWNSVCFGTNWGSGGVQRSNDYGETWPTVNSAGSAWGVDIADDDPSCVIFGVYSGGQSYLSLDSGSTYVGSPLPGSNYGFYARDRETLLALQSGGIYRLVLNYSYTPNVVEVADRAGGLQGFVLEQNRPNPFDGSTEIRFTLPRAARVSLEVYDVMGHRVATLASGMRAAGSHGVSFRPGALAKEPLSAGVYFYRFQTGAFSATRKMLVLR